MLITIKRNGRMFLNKQSLKEEEIFDLYIDGKKQMHGICYVFFCKSTGIKFNKGQKRTFKIENEFEKI